MDTDARGTADAVEAFEKADPKLAPLVESSAGLTILPKEGKEGFGVVGAHEAGLMFENRSVSAGWR